MSQAHYETVQRAQEWFEDDCQAYLTRNRYACSYCGQTVPDGSEPSNFVCCGECGHTEVITEET